MMRPINVMGLVFGLGALLFKPVILPFVLETQRSKVDARIGQLDVLTAEELSGVYDESRALVVGGTRGVGGGIALALARAGAHVTIVGRSKGSAERTLAAMRAVAPPERRLQFVQGDLGTAAGSKVLVEDLARHAESYGRFQYLFVSAAIFTKWGDVFQEDGLERSYAIAVMGRFLVYRNMHRFMVEGRQARVLNVLASGSALPLSFDRGIAAGSRPPKWLLESMCTFALGNELMLVALHQHEQHHAATWVSTHPGVLKTDLHRNQGWVLDLVEAFFVALMGVSEQECGVRQASILASPKLPWGQLSYVDEDMRGRVRHAQVDMEWKEHGDWLWTQLQKFT